jgi:hypothetical protein
MGDVSPFLIHLLGWFGFGSLAGFVALATSYLMRRKSDLRIDRSVAIAFVVLTVLGAWFGLGLLAFVLLTAVPSMRGPEAAMIVPGSLAIWTYRRLLW